MPATTRPTPSRPLLTLALLAAATSPAHAVLYTWTGHGSTLQWGDTNNWFNNAPPNSGGNTAVVMTGFTKLSNTFDANNLSLNSFTFSADAGPFSITAKSASDSLTFLTSPGGVAPHIDQNSDSPQFLHFPTSGMNLTADTFLNGNGAGDLTIKGALIGPGRLILNAPYTLVLQSLGANNTHGGITLNAGTLRAASGEIFGSGSFVMNGGSLQYAAPFTLATPVTLGSGGGAIDPAGVSPTLNSTLSGPGHLTVANSSLTPSSLTFAGSINNDGGLLFSGPALTVVLSAPNSYSGTATVSNGAVLSVDSDARLGKPSATLTLDNGTLRTTNASPVSLSRILTLAAGGGTFDTTGPATFTLATSLSGPGGLTKTGAGTLSLANSNSFTGPTTLSAGTLFLGNGGALQTSTLNLSGGSLTFGGTGGYTLGALAGPGDLPMPPLAALNVGNNNASTTYSGNLSGGAPNFSLTKSGAGTWTLAGNNSHAGSLIVAGGTVIAASPTALAPSAALSVSSGATLDLGGFNFSASRAVNLAGGGTLRLNGATLTLNNPAASNLAGSIPMSFGTISVSASSAASYSGATLTSGFLAGTGTHSFTNSTLSNVTSFPGTNLNHTSGTLTLTNSTIGGNLATTGTLNWTNGTLAPAGYLTVNGTANLVAVASTGALVLTPGGVLNNSVTPLTLGGGSRTAVSSFATLNLLNNTSLELNGALLINDGTINGPVSVNYGSTAKGAGTYNGAVTVSDGGVFLANAPAPASLIVGSLELATGALANINTSLVIDYATSPVGVVRTNILAAYHGGLWDQPGIGSSNAADPARGFHTAVAYLDNAFANLPSFAGRPADPTSLFLKYTYYGDANLDGILNADDFALLDQGFASQGHFWWQGDFDYDGQITPHDYLLLDSTYAQQSGPLSPDFLSQRESQFGPAYVSSLLTAIPEPTSLLLLATDYWLLTTLTARPRRHRSSSRR